MVDSVKPKFGSLLLQPPGDQAQIMTSNVIVTHDNLGIQPLARWLKKIPIMFSRYRKRYSLQWSSWHEILMLLSAIIYMQPEQKKFRDYGRETMMYIHHCIWNDTNFSLLMLLALWELRRNNRIRDENFVLRILWSLTTQP